MLVPREPAPFEDEAQRTRNLENRDFSPSRFSKWVLIGGCVALLAFGLAALLGQPGLGVILVPIGLVMILGGGIQVLFDRLNN